MRKGDKVWSRVYADPTSQKWKAYAQNVIQIALREAEMVSPLFGVDDAVRVSILAVFECPRSLHRKRRPRLRQWKTSGFQRQDVDNVAKAVLDAANGVLWVDDRQVVQLQISKLIGAQGEPPAVYLRAGPASEHPPGAQKEPTLFD
jgi:Holliday junction resolvase RusA-like endonuclease